MGLHRAQARKSLVAPRTGTGVQRYVVAVGAMAAAAKQERVTAYAALPRIKSKMNQHTLLQKSVTPDARGRSVAALGTVHFFSLFHSSYFR